MDWKEYYTSRLVSAEEAVSHVASGASIITGLGASTADILVRALAERARQTGSPRELRIGNMLPLSDATYLNPEYKEFFRYRSIFASGLSREALSTGEADFVACHFHEYPSLFRPDGEWPVDVVFVVVSPPNANGQVSLGISVDYTLEACRQAMMIIAEVNPNMPDIPGNSYLNVTDIDYFVASERPVTVLPQPKIGAVEEAIGGFIAPFIKDGDCLQLGIGAIPDAVLTFLGEKNDLGIHSEMVSDGVMHLVEKGVITGSRKTLHRDKAVVAFVMGSEKFYRWINHNSRVEMYPVNYVNDPRVIAQNDNMISINSAISIDLLGQVASDMMGSRVFSGTGGQVDFVRGAAMSKGGKSFIALPATAGKGKLSRICVALERGQAVTTPRSDVEYVVTEFGVARLKGLSNLERSEALISLAAPEFRDELRRQRRELYGW